MLGNTIKNNLQAYDKQQSILKEKLLPSYNIQIENKDTDLEHPVIRFLDGNEVVYSSEYEIMGTYVHSEKLWSWAWSNPSYAKKETNISKNIFDYGYSLGVDDVYFRSILTTSRGHVQNYAQLDIMLSLIGSVCKNYQLFNINVDIGEISMFTYILLLDKIE